MTAPAAAPTPQADTRRQPDSIKATEPGTDYFVFKQLDGGAWDRVNKPVTARTAEQAIRSVVDELADKDKSGTYAATPARSFKPLTVKQQTVTTLKLEEAK